MTNKYHILMLALVVFFLLSACDGFLKESTQVMGGVGAGLSEYQE
jgi:hypothetical protein